jgi:antirestriction protein
MEQSQIYIACLAAYNNGYLHGKWIDATLGEDCIQDEIKDILATSPIPNAEEWAIHDFDNVPQFIQDNYKDFDDLERWINAYHEHSEVIFLMARDVGLNDIDEIINYDEQNYRNDWGSFKEFAIDYFYEHEECPPHLIGYIDFDSYAYELLHDYFTIEHNGRTHVYYSE